MLLNLPEVLFQEIQSCLDKNDYLYLINTTNLLASVKKNTIYYPLNVKYSIEYYQNPIFREQLLLRMRDPKRQLRLHYQFTQDEWTILAKNLPYFIPSTAPLVLPAHHMICNFTIPNLQSFEKFQNIAILEKLSIGKEITDFPFLPTLQDLCVAEAKGLTNGLHLSHLQRLTLCSCPELVDIHCLRNIPDLQLIFCAGIDDFSSLGGEKQVRLHIGSCRGLRTVTNLSRVKHLSLENCKNLFDIRALKGIYDLEIIDCVNIENLEELGNHGYRLAIHGSWWDNYDLENYQIFENVPHVELKNCNIRKLDHLRYATSVKLQFCSNVKDVRPLAKVKEVTLESCLKITDIRSLKDVSQLILSELSFQKLRFPTFTPSQKISIFHAEDETDISHCSYLNQLMKGEKVKAKEFELIFLAVPKIDLILTHYAAALHKIDILELSCSSLKSLDSALFSTIPTVKIITCDNLSSIAGLGKNRSVHIEACTKITEVKSLKDVPEVTIIDCRGINDYSCLSKVPRLKIILPLK